MTFFLRGLHGVADRCHKGGRRFLLKRQTGRMCAFYDRVTRSLLRKYTGREHYFLLHKLCSYYQGLFVLTVEKLGHNIPMLISKLFQFF